MKLRNRAIVIAIVVASAVTALTGCSGLNADHSGAALTTSTVPPISSHTRSGSHAPTNTGGAGTGGAGSLTVAITTPVAVAGFVNTDVSCSTGRQYHASAGPVVVDGSSISLQVVIAGYSAPGSYSAIVTASITPTGSTSTSVAGLPNIPATVTGTGGSVNLSATGTDGRVIAGAITWACS